MTNDKIQNFTMRVSQANRTEMVTILYDIGQTYIEDAVNSLKNDNKTQFRVEVGRVRNTLKELMNSVDTSQQLGQNLLELYIFCSSELTKAFIYYSATELYHVGSIFKKLGDAYREAAKKDLSGPVMANAQKVYDGITYNRNLTMDSMQTADAKRGIYA